MTGPVVTDARAALAAAKPDAVLKWIRSSDEAEVRTAFERTLAVRKLSAEAAELADRWFFENVVRIHRAGEGAPYAGLKDTEPALPAITAADNALTSGDLRPLLDLSLQHVSAELTARFERLRETAKHKEHNVDAGRAYVEAYVDFVHYAESVFGPTAGDAHEAASEHRH